MPQLNAKMRNHTDPFGAPFVRRLRAMDRAERQAREKAAKVATQRTRSNFQYRRSAISPRPGRSSTGGKMRQHLNWTSRNGVVEFDMAEADRQAPHWIIQEIGTGSKAVVRQANKPNPTGRPAKGASYVKSVRSQKGRPISGGLVWATGGVYSAPGTRRGEQLEWASRTRGLPNLPRDRRRARIIINKEISAQNFVKKGGTTGFRVYEKSVLAAARQAFRKSNAP